MRIRTGLAKMALMLCSLLLAGFASLIAIKGPEGVTHHPFTMAAVFCGAIGSFLGKDLSHD